MICLIYDRPPAVGSSEKFKFNFFMEFFGCWQCSSTKISYKFPMACFQKLLGNQQATFVCITPAVAIRNIPQYIWYEILNWTHWINNAAKWNFKISFLLQHISKVENNKFQFSDNSLPPVSTSPLPYTARKHTSFEQNRCCHCSTTTAATTDFRCLRNLCLTLKMRIKSSFRSCSKHFRFQLFIKPRLLACLN